MGDGAADFKTPLFGCFEDKTLCIMSFFMPNYVFGRMAEIILMEGEEYYTGKLKYKDNEWSRIVDSLLWMGTFSPPPTLCFMRRQKLRAKLGYTQQPAETMDCVWSVCCPCCCVLTQMAREMHFAPIART